MSRVVAADIVRAQTRQLRCRASRAPSRRCRDKAREERWSFEDCLHRHHSTRAVFQAAAASPGCGSSVSRVHLDDLMFEAETFFETSALINTTSRSFSSPTFLMILCAFLSSSDVNATTTFNAFFVLFAFL